MVRAGVAIAHGQSAFTKMFAFCLGGAALHDEVHDMGAALATAMSRRVLVVDDHPDSADACCMLLSLLGHTCRAAISGEHALAVDAGFHPDIVICDIGLPGISGYELAVALRERHGARIFLAALTGWDQPPDRERSFASGFDLHLVKPAGAQMLGAVMLAASRAGHSVGAVAGAVVCESGPGATAQ